MRTIAADAYVQEGADVQKALLRSTPLITMRLARKRRIALGLLQRLCHYWAASVPLGYRCRWHLGCQEGRLEQESRKETSHT